MFSSKIGSPARGARHPALTLALISVVALSACAPSGPASRSELCDAYKTFQSESQAWHPISNSGVFRSLRNLGDVAVRYEANQSVKAAGPELKRMGSADSFSLMEAQFTAAPIAAECLRTSSP
jgi:hypothetical protein